jgi:hypothetical protein
MAFMGGKGGMRSGAGIRGDVIPKGHRATQLQQYTPEQMQLFEQSLGMVGPDSYLNRLAGGDQSLFEEMEAPAMRQFQGTLGGIASKFSGQGMGSRRSSGFQHATTSAASNFAQELQANRQNLQRQAIMDLMGISSTLLDKRPYERSLQQKPEEKPSGKGSIVGGLLGGVGGAFFGMPVQGAMVGSQLGSMF